MKKLLFRTLLGFSLGITLLMISYLGIYYLAGSEKFNSAVLKLSNISVFQNQILVAGLFGIIISFTVYLIEISLLEEQDSLFMRIVSITSLLLSLVISLFLLKNINNFDITTINILVITSIILVAFYYFANYIKDAVDTYIINKKIKEKNG